MVEGVQKQPQGRLAMLQFDERNESMYRNSMPAAELTHTSTLRLVPSAARQGMAGQGRVGQGRAQTQAGAGVKR